MKVIHLVRKPLEGSVAKNSIKWGTGGLNIDGTRVGSESRVNPPAANKAGGSSYNMSVVGMPEDAVSTSASGRWPANLILQHHPDCRLVGVKKVKGSPSSSQYHEAYKGESATGLLRGHSHPGNQHGSTNGTETVGNWQCHPECPVPILDGQSGLSISREPGSVVKKASASNQNGNRGAALGAESCPEGTVMTTHGDTGGASRFFKQVKGTKNA